MSVLLLYLPIDELEKKEIVFDESDRVSNEDRIPRTSLIEFNGFFFFFSRNDRLMLRSIFNSIHRDLLTVTKHTIFLFVPTRFFQPGRAIPVAPL